MTTSPALWHLRLTSFRGIVFGATHTFAELAGAGQRVAVARVLGVAGAAELRRRDGGTWKATDVTNRFNTEVEAQTAALAVWRAIADPRVDALVLGSAAYAEPQPVLAGPETFTAEANRLVDLAEACHQVGGWDHDPDLLDDLCRRWDQLRAAHHYGDRGPEELRAREVAVDKIDGAWQVRQRRIEPTADE